MVLVGSPQDDCGLELGAEKKSPARTRASMRTAPMNEIHAMMINKLLKALT